MTETVLERYQQAQNFMDGISSKTMVINDAVFPHWIGDTDCFWYQRDTVEGKEYRLVDAARASNELAFDHQALAKALETAAAKPVDAQDLPILLTEISPEFYQVHFTAFEKEWVFDTKQSACTEKEPAPAIEGIVSPNQTKTVFIRDYNIWVRDLVTGEEQLVTEDGSAECRYGKSVSFMGTQLPFEAIWSPDSQYLFTYQLDTRGVRVRKSYIPVPSDGGIEPDIIDEKRSSPGDEITETYTLKMIAIETKENQEVDHPPLVPGRFSYEFFSFEGFGWWSADSQSAYFIDMERGDKGVRVIAVSPRTGVTRVILEETSDTFIRLSHNPFPEPPLFMPLPASNELIWYSERDGWGQLYLYDLDTGELKNRITEGEWVVRKVLSFNEERRELIIQTSGRDSSISPYYQDVCLISIDSGSLLPLATGNYEHIIYDPNRYPSVVRVGMGLDAPGIDGTAPSGNYVAVTRSRVDTLPTSILIDREGNEVLTLEQTQNTGLPKDWYWPEPVSYKAADGETELCGVIFRPPGYSEDKSYPVLDYSYTAPYSSSLPQGSFSNGLFVSEPYFVGSAYAALGFIVVCLEVRGTPCRSKAFQDIHYGTITAVNGFDDRIAGMRQLAERYPSMDLNRVGIASYDGSISPVYGLLEHPEFYKVGINVDFEDARFHPRSLAEMCGEVSSIKRPYDDELLSRLQGKLLLIHGLKHGTPPEMTLHLIDAFQKLHKDIDMVLEPSSGHCVSSYAFKKTWDYLVRHLQGLEPPKEFRVMSVMERFSGEVEKLIAEITQYEGPK